MSGSSKIVVLIMGKSGCGKSTLERNLIEQFPSHFKKVVSSTTRPIREGEIDGEDYYFLTDEEYDNTDFIQTTEFAGYRYGSAVSEYQTHHPFPILVVVPDSAKSFTKTLAERFPTWAWFNVYFELSKNMTIANMQKRGDTPEMIEKRLAQDTLDEQFNSSGLIPNFLIYDRDMSDDHQDQKSLASRVAAEIMCAKVHLDIHNAAKINYNI